MTISFSSSAVRFGISGDKSPLKRQHEELDSDRLSAAFPGRNTRQRTAEPVEEEKVGDCIVVASSNPVASPKPLSRTDSEKYNAMAEDQLRREMRQMHLRTLPPSPAGGSDDADVDDSSGRLIDSEELFKLSADSDDHMEYGRQADIYHSLKELKETGPGGRKAIRDLADRLMQVKLVELLELAKKGHSPSEVDDRLEELKKMSPDVKQAIRTRVDKDELFELAKKKDNPFQVIWNLRDKYGNNPALVELAEKMVNPFEPICDLSANYLKDEDLMNGDGTVSSDVRNYFGRIVNVKGPKKKKITLQEPQKISQTPSLDRVD
jgi:hypothetical protein